MHRTLSRRELGSWAALSLFLCNFLVLQIKHSSISTNEKKISWDKSGAVELGWKLKACLLSCSPPGRKGLRSEQMGCWEFSHLRSPVTSINVQGIMHVICCASHFPQLVSAGPCSHCPSLAWAVKPSWAYAGEKGINLYENTKPLDLPTEITHPKNF